MNRTKAFLIVQDASKWSSVYLELGLNIWDDFSGIMINEDKNGRRVYLKVDNN